MGPEDLVYARDKRTPRCQLSVLLLVHVYRILSHVSRWEGVRVSRLPFDARYTEPLIFRCLPCVLYTLLAENTLYIDYYALPTNITTTAVSVMVSRWLVVEQMLTEQGTKFWY